MVGRRAQLVLSVLALLLSGILTLLAGPPVSSGTETVSRPVLTRSKPVGSAITADDLATRSFPAAAVQGTVADPAALVGKRLRASWPAGVPLLPEVVGEDLPGELLPGTAEVAVELGRAAALDGRLLPGETVWAVVPEGNGTAVLGPATVLGVGPVEGDERRLRLRLRLPAAQARRTAEALLQNRSLYLYRAAAPAVETPAGEGP